ncbi:kinase-domain conntaining protein [Acrasis kona]|uniref:Kinase-domain conntaining protein n=1 Tax=Acrasis kona TaxID=1008807 RepID=A0AAW2ZG66_9EUKA
MHDVVPNQRDQLIQSRNILLNNSCIGKINFDVGSRYQIVNKPIRSSLGNIWYVVIKISSIKEPSVAIDTLSGDKVSIKKIPKAFTHSIEDTKRVLQEIKILKCISHPNIIKILDLPKPPSYDMFDDVYVVFELMQTNLQYYGEAYKILFISNIEIC